MTFPQLLRALWSPRRPGQPGVAAVAAAVGVSPQTIKKLRSTGQGSPVLVARVLRHLLDAGTITEEQYVEMVLAWFEGLAP